MCVKENSTALACFWFAVCGHVDVSMNGCRRFTGNELGRIYPWEKKDVSESKSECPHISAVREEEVQTAWTGQTILQTIVFSICI